jgi:SAM-dependent methyltransferase
MENKEWYESWFDSPYYHILYKNRDGSEARRFIDNLIHKFQLAAGSRVLDLCCGKGRHALYLNSLGFNVTGVDLSPRNIRYCRQHETENLEFYVHDMRHLFRTNYFHAIFNLFTSFGYFEREHDNELSISAAAKGLAKGGILVIDFMNAWRAVNDLIPLHSKTVDGIEFQIKKRICDGFIYKDITFSDSGGNYQYREEVKILLLKDFEKYMKNAGLEILFTFGSYDLSPYVQESSNRLIIVAAK